MATEIATSVAGTAIRLTDERWAHIEEEHGELHEMRAAVLDTTAHPERILAGTAGAKIATKPVSDGKWIVVVYRELEGDGFVITAFLTRRIRALNRRDQLWP